MKKIISLILALTIMCAAMLTSSGQAASLISILNICEAGDHMISTSAIYGGTFNLFSVTLKKFGIDVTFVDTEISEEDLQKEVKENTKLIFSVIYILRQFFPHFPVPT